MKFDQSLVIYPPAQLTIRVEVFEEQGFEEQNFDEQELLIDRFPAAISQFHLRPWIHCKSGIEDGHHLTAEIFG